LLILDSVLPGYQETFSQMLNTDQSSICDRYFRNNPSFDSLPNSNRNFNSNSNPNSNQAQWLFQNNENPSFPVDNDLFNFNTNFQFNSRPFNGGLQNFFTRRALSKPSVNSSEPVLKQPNPNQEKQFQFQGRSFSKRSISDMDSNPDSFSDQSNFLPPNDFKSKNPKRHDDQVLKSSKISILGLNKDLDDRASNHGINFKNDYKDKSSIGFDEASNLLDANTESGFGPGSDSDSEKSDSKKFISDQSELSEPTGDQIESFKPTEDHSESSKLTNEQSKLESETIFPFDFKSRHELPTDYINASYQTENNPMDINFNLSPGISISIDLNSTHDSTIQSNLLTVICPISLCPASYDDRSFLNYRVPEPTPEDWAKEHKYNIEDFRRQEIHHARLTYNANKKLGGLKLKPKNCGCKVKQTALTD